MFKKDIGSRVYKNWINYCFINILERTNKFFIDNQFFETIIKENKNKVKLSVNATLDKFSKEILTLNIILFAKTRKVMAKKGDATNYNNHHLVVNNTLDVLK